MSRLVPVLAVLLAVLPSAVRADKPGCADHPLFPTRMPGYVLDDCKVEEFGSYGFFAPKGKKTPVEGKVTYLAYAFTGPRSSEPSGLAIVRNYQAAIAKAGGTIVQSDPSRWVNGTIVKGGQEAWAQAEKGNGRIWMRIVEKRAMNQYVVADAAALGNDLEATGHVTVHGIYFDTDRSEVKPESTPALEEITRLLARHPALRLKVVGHTDMTGSLDANLKLSEARAGAVVQALVAKHGVDKARLASHGVGPLAPVASNDSDEGRARNRRVELVKE